MGEPAIAEAPRFTWDDYRSWDDAGRWEIIDGRAYAMTPAPTTRHQAILHELDLQLGLHFRERPCRVFPAPTDVKLDAENVVQPDLAVVCDEGKIKHTHIEGAPTLIVEILSPSTAAFDRARKLALYATSRVREVWLITPYPWLAEVLVLERGSYRIARVYERNDTLASVVFPELRVELARVFDYPIDPDEQVALVKQGRPPYGSP